MSHARHALHRQVVEKKASVRKGFDRHAYEAFGDVVGVEVDVEATGRAPRPHHL